MLRALAAKAEPGAEVARRNLRFWAKKHMESAYYVDLQRTDESRTRGGSRATEPAFLGKNTRNLHITWTWSLLTKAEPGAAVARRNLRFWAKNTWNLHITWTCSLLTKPEPGAAVARQNLRFWAKPHGICILRRFWCLFKNAVENQTKNLQNFWGAGMPLWYFVRLAETMGKTVGKH